MRVAAGGSRSKRKDCAPTRWSWAVVGASVNRVIGPDRDTGNQGEAIGTIKTPQERMSESARTVRMKSENCSPGKFTLTAACGGAVQSTVVSGGQPGIRVRSVGSVKIMND